jgi:hypothetical protein
LITPFKKRHPNEEETEKKSWWDKTFQLHNVQRGEMSNDLVLQQRLMKHGEYSHYAYFSRDHATKQKYVQNYLSSEGGQIHATLVRGFLTSTSRADRLCLVKQCYEWKDVFEIGEVCAKLGVKLVVPPISQPFSPSRWRQMLQKLQRRPIMIHQVNESRDLGFRSKRHWPDCPLARVMPKPPEVISIVR